MAKTQEIRGQNSPPGPKAFKTTLVHPSRCVQAERSREGGPPPAHPVTAPSSSTHQTGPLSIPPPPLPQQPRLFVSYGWHFPPGHRPGPSRPHHTQGPHGPPHAVSCPEQAAAVLWPVCPQTGTQLQDGPLFCPGKGGLTQSSASTTTLQPPMPPCLLASCEWPPHSPYPDSPRNQPQGPSSLSQGP